LVDNVAGDLEANKYHRWVLTKATPGMEASGRMTRRRRVARSAPHNKPADGSTPIRNETGTQLWSNVERWWAGGGRM
jgi:hypothetical protein